MYTQSYCTYLIFDYLTQGYEEIFFWKQRGKYPAEVLDNHIYKEIL